MSVFGTGRFAHLDPLNHWQAYPHYQIRHLHGTSIDNARPYYPCVLVPIRHGLL